MSIIRCSCPALSGDNSFKSKRPVSKTLLFGVVCIAVGGKSEPSDNEEPDSAEPAPRKKSGTVFRRLSFKRQSSSGPYFPKWVNPNKYIRGLVTYKQLEANGELIDINTGIPIPRCLESFDTQDIESQIIKSSAYSIGGSQDLLDQADPTPTPPPPPPPDSQSSDSYPSPPSSPNFYSAARRPPFGNSHFLANATWVSIVPQPDPNAVTEDPNFVEEEPPATAKVLGQMSRTATIKSSSGRLDKRWTVASRRKDGTARPGPVLVSSDYQGAQMQVVATDVPLDAADGQGAKPKAKPPLPPPKPPKRYTEFKTQSDSSSQDTLYLWSPDSVSHSSGSGSPVEIEESWLVMQKRFPAQYDASSRDVRGQSPREHQGTPPRSIPDPSPREYEGASSSYFPDPPPLPKNSQGTLPRSIPDPPLRDYEGASSSYFPDPPPLPKNSQGTLPRSIPPPPLRDDQGRSRKKSQGTLFKNVPEPPPRDDQGRSHKDYQGLPPSNANPRSPKVQRAKAPAEELAPSEMQNQVALLLREGPEKWIAWDRFGRVLPRNSDGLICLSIPPKKPANQSKFLGLFKKSDSRKKASEDYSVVHFERLANKYYRRQDYPDFKLAWNPIWRGAYEDFLIRVEEENRLLMGHR